MPRVFCSTVLLAIALWWLQPVLSNSPGSPILIVPGLMGSQLEVKDTETLCTTSGEFYGLWIDPLRFVDLLCGQRELELVYDSQNDVYSSHSGVTTRVPGFGQTRSVQYINTDPIIPIPYMRDMVRYFVERGYTDGHNIRAAPYDWRLAADNLDRAGYFDMLKSLVEEMYQQNGREKITVVVHSMGGPVSLYFFTEYRGINQEWKDMYINAWVTLSGAWNGGNSALEKIIAGPASHIPSIFQFLRHIANEIAIPVVRSIQSIIWMLPREFVWGDTVLVSTPSRNYTALDYQQLFEDIGISEGLSRFNGIRDINANYPPPNVTTYCYYGVDVKTVVSMSFTENFQSDVVPAIPTLMFGDGDGTVNIQSSEVCLRWKNMTGTYPFESRTFSNVSHSAMVTNETVLAALGEIVGASSQPTRCPPVLDPQTVQLVTAIGILSAITIILLCALVAVMTCLCGVLCCKKRREKADIAMSMKSLPESENSQ